MEYTEKHFKNIRNNHPIRIFNYTFLNDYNNHFPINIIYGYCSSKINYKLKNIWNHIVLKWIQANGKLNDNNFIKSIYYKQKYNFIHHNIDDNKLNELLNDFIKNDIFKAVFVVECINCL